MTRLRYTLIGNLLFTDWFTIGPNFIVRGVIDTTKYSFDIQEFNGDLVYKGQAINLRQAKTLLKKQLVVSGVIFTGEIRR